MPTRKIFCMCRNYVLFHLSVLCFQPNNFLRVNFFATFSTDLNSASNYAFFDTHIKIIWKKYLFGHISTFCKLWSQTRAKRLQKSKNIFYKCVLEFNFASFNGSGLLIIYKKTLNRCSLLYRYYTPKRIKARILNLIIVLIRLARGEGRVAMICFVMEVCKGGCTGCLNRGCLAASHCQFQLLVCSTWGLLIIIT
jgi:hypothetical protein